MIIQDVLNELNIPFRDHTQSSHVTPGWVGIVCPMPGCGQGGKFGRGINVRKLTTTCWKCGPARLGDVLAAAADKPLRDVMPLVTALAPGLAHQDATARTGRYSPPAGVGPLQPAHRRYLERRGFDPDELVETYKIGGLDGLASLKWRLFLPVFAPDGKPGSWTTRAIGRNVEPRYVSARPDQEARSIKTLLAFEHLARHAAVVTEGLFGAMRIGPGGVATMGVVVSPPQLARIARFPVRVICFDSDDAGRKRADRLADDLAPYPGQTFVVTLSGPDPDTSPMDEIAELRERFLR